MCNTKEIENMINEDIAFNKELYVIEEKYNKRTSSIHKSLDITDLKKLMTYIDGVLYGGVQALNWAYKLGYLDCKKQKRELKLKKVK